MKNEIKILFIVKKVLRLKCLLYTVFGYPDILKRKISMKKTVADRLKL